MTPTLPHFHKKTRYAVSFFRGIYREHFPLKNLTEKKLDVLEHRRGLGG